MQHYADHAAGRPPCERRGALDCGEVIRNAQKYINIAALIALAGWLGLGFKMGWY